MSAHGDHHRLHERLGVALAPGSVTALSQAMAALTAESNSAPLRAGELADLLRVLTQHDLDARSFQPVYNWKAILVVLDAAGEGVEMHLEYNKHGRPTWAKPKSAATRLSGAFTQRVGAALDAFKAGKPGRLSRGHLFGGDAAPVSPASEDVVTLLRGLRDRCRDLGRGGGDTAALEEAVRGGCDLAARSSAEGAAGLRSRIRIPGRDGPDASSKQSQVGWVGERVIFEYLTRRMRLRWPGAAEDEHPVGNRFQVDGALVGEVLWPDRVWKGERQRRSVDGFDLVSWGISGGEDAIMLHEVKATEAAAQSTIIRNRMTRQQRGLALAVGPAHYTVWDVHDVSGDRGGVFQAIDWRPEDMLRHQR